MATEAAHLKKAEPNQRFLETIGDDFPDWLAVVAFYKAVHLVEALFARKKSPSHNHSQRNYRLKRQFPSIWMHFRPLYGASMLLRYTDRMITSAHVRQELIANRLKAVETLVHQELSLL
jgi:inorganic triphosphatase YgiF